MNARNAVYLLLSAVVCGLSSPTFSAPAAMAQSDLERDAKLDRTHAEQLALMRAPEGTVKSAHLERDNGKLVWWFDISQYHGRSGIVEVQVDAMTGEIISSKTKAP